MTDEFIAQKYFTGYMHGQVDERARIVLYLRNRDTYDFDDLAIDIEAGEHNGMGEGATNAA